MVICCQCSVPVTEQQATVYIGVVQKLVKSHSMIVLLAASLIAVKLNFRVPDVIGIYKKSVYVLNN